ncbi:MAG: glucosamine-6-phosphate deaminase [Bacteroidetes bacterium]|nr:glucosamine-6-phosphate deaminase [Bacteroidota bacterium]
MKISTYNTPIELGIQAAQKAAELIRFAIQSRGEANIILATGASQFEMLANLVNKDIPWEKVTMFHLDEYIGIDATHLASFQKYLQERFVDKVPGVKAYHFIRGNAEDPQAECQRVSDIITRHPIDVAMIGIGENGHLAFNDPPADFQTEEPYIVVELDEDCRLQQLGEGWFPDLASVPEKAISMSIQHILKSQHLIVSVPDRRKAQAVQGAVNGPISPDCPASILRQHPHCQLFLDQASASLL